MFGRQPPRLAAPPRLSTPPRLSKPRLPWWRQAARGLVWAVFGLVVAARFVFSPDPAFRGPGFQIGGGGGGFWGQEQGGRRYRPGKRIGDPQSEVPTNLWRIRIEVSAKDMQALRRTSFEWRRPSKDKRPEVSVTVHEGGVTYSNVALHLKGSAGSFRSVDQTPAMTLNFSKHAKGRTFHGYSKVSLNNSVQDPSYVAEALTRGLFEAAGVPSPQTDHATVILNGRDLGLYVFAEGWGKPFLKRHFKNPDGVLYDGGFVQDVDGDLGINSGPEEAGRAILDRLWEAAMEQDPEERWKRLEAVLDVERFASLLAMEVLTCHWDGYGLNRNNYRVYHDPESGRAIFLPHGMDQVFGRGGRMGPEAPIEPYMRGVVARGFLFTEQGRKLYYERMSQFRAEFFDAGRMNARVKELSDRVRPTLAAYGSAHVAEHDEAVRELCTSIERRVRSVDEQLARPRTPVEFDGEGVLRLSGWEPRAGAQGRGGGTQFLKSTEDGRELLRIVGGPGGVVGSWRTRVRLGPGRYRIEGRVRTQGMGGQGGACLRISGGAKRYRAGEEGAWTEHSFPFEISEPFVEAELVCECDAVRGEVEFDAGTLVLVREGGGRAGGRRRPGAGGDR